MRFLVLGFIPLLCSCSTLNSKQKTLSYMGAGFVGGYTAGYGQADRSQENPNMHGALWGAASAALIGAITVYLQDDNQEIENKNLKIVSLERELEVMRFGEHRKIDEGINHLFEKELPQELQSHVKAGEWELYEVDEWKKVSDGVLIHQDRLFRFKEPKFKVTK